MKSVQKNLVRHFISSALLILAFGPNLVSGIFGDQPRYSDQGESSENQERVGDADKAGTPDPSNGENAGRETFLNQGTPRDMATNAPPTLNHK